MVARRRTGRPKEQDHKALGKAWDTPIGIQGSTDPLGLYFRRDLPGWHFTNALDVPDNITLIPLPSKSPELNPVENVWQFMRENWLSNRIFKSCNDILDHCCFAWNQLVNQPWRIMSIGLREWAYV
jgi:hypothetical protein